ncbi:PRTRC system protein E, partial [Phocaeicola vulgatus]
MTGTGCWRSSSTDRKNTVIYTLIHIIMFFTAINQMMTEGVD